jgi:UDP-glucose 4-epimerase
MTGKPPESAPSRAQKPEWQVIQACEKVTGQKIPTVEKPRRPGDPPRLVASAGKAIQELGWKPKYSKLDDIVATAWAWHKKHPNGYAD